MGVSVVGAGLAGCEAAWQLAQRGIDVTLYDMKPNERSEAHHSDELCELVCSNSLRANSITNAVGLLKEELRMMGSLVLECADATAVEAGNALAVDRIMFSKLVSLRIAKHSRIKIVHNRVDTLPDGDVIIATGPLTHSVLAEEIAKLLGQAGLHFYDAAAPIVSADSIDMNTAYFASRYGRGEPSYINCPMDESRYHAFTEQLKTAEEAPVHGFEDSRVFEGCMPVEVMARRGTDTLRYGPLKPVGLPDPKTGRTPYAVVQLRREDKDGTMYNIVGFQTHLKFPEQKRVFRMIPGLENATFLRYGVMHRNTFIDSPAHLDRYYVLKSSPRIAFVGQMTGVEGYVESVSSGLYAAINMANRINGLRPLSLGNDTATGALAQYISGYAGKNFQPMNVNFGIMEPYGERIKDKAERYAAVAQRAVAAILKGIADIL